MLQLKLIIFLAEQLQRSPTPDWLFDLRDRASLRSGVTEENNTDETISPNSEIQGPAEKNASLETRNDVLRGPVAAENNVGPELLVSMFKHTKLNI